MSKGTIPKSMRLKDDLWKAALRAAAARGETVTDVVRDALTEYAVKYDPEGFTPPPPEART